ncbi:hypothetical protein AB0B31_31760 [Catellatospora citrea]|uniref:hypothetical protein n=1 Tax=Catellatospora citrea TaxID=53366 RepID=UPI00340A7831
MPSLPGRLRVNRPSRGCSRVSATSRPALESPAMLSLRRIALAFVAAILASTVGVPAAARAAGVGLAPYFVEYGNGMSTTASQTGSTKVPIGVMTWGAGTATGVRLTVDLSDVTDKVDITGVSSPCGRSGSIVTCNFGTLTIDGERKVGATLSLRAKPTATIGTAGTVHLRLASDPAPGDATVSGTVDIRPNVADMVMTSTVPTAQIGQTVTVSHTVKNLGPAAQPHMTLGAEAAQPGIRYVGGNGCTTTATTFLCRIEDLAVGQTRVVTVQAKVNGCDPTKGANQPGVGWTADYGDPHTSNNNATIIVKVSGCSGSTGTSSGGSGTQSAPKPASGKTAAPRPASSPTGSPIASPAASAAVTPTATDIVSQGPTAAAASIAPVAATVSASSTGVWTAISVLAGLAALAGFVVFRRRRNSPQV